MNKISVGEAREMRAGWVLAVEVNSLVLVELVLNSSVAAASMARFLAGKSAEDLRAAKDAAEAVADALPLPGVGEKCDERDAFKALSRLCGVIAAANPDFNGGMSVEYVGMTYRDSTGRSYRVVELPAETLLETVQRRFGAYTTLSQVCSGDTQYVFSDYDRVEHLVAVFKYGDDGYDVLIDADRHLMAVVKVDAPADSPDRLTFWVLDPSEVVDSETMED